MPKREKDHVVTETARENGVSVGDVYTEGKLLHTHTWRTLGKV
jgi:hypothetical protein